LERFKKLDHVGEVRQKGFMTGIELVQSRRTKKPYSLVRKTGVRVALECRRNGLIIRPLGNVVVLMPPLMISMKELKRMIEIVYRAIKAVTETD